MRVRVALHGDACRREPVEVEVVAPQRAGQVGGAAERGDHRGDPSLPVERFFVFGQSGNVDEFRGKVEQHKSATTVSLKL